MKVDGRSQRSIEPVVGGVSIVDQTRLPFTFERVLLRTVDEAARAIATMQVRGAPLIGATAAWGLALAARAHADGDSLERAANLLTSTRPTAINLHRVVSHVLARVLAAPHSQRAGEAERAALEVCEEELDRSRRIGQHGQSLLHDLYEKLRRPLNVLTHCNAGWLATIDLGTALAPIYAAFDAGLPLHVWVDETRPRNQGANLTAWELRQHGVPNTLIVDNAGGLLMRQGRVDACLVGTDRVTTNGDVCNKIGTYLKALAAFDNQVPFWVAAPESSIDWGMASGDEVPLEARDATEVTHVSGLDDAGVLRRVRLTAEGTPVHNPGFDVTPARLVSALITEAGVCQASTAGLRGLFPEAAP
jgi:methylthioribose-1-phosphate isomerase